MSFKALEKLIPEFNISPDELENGNNEELKKILPERLDDIAMEIIESFEILDLKIRSQNGESFSQYVLGNKYFSEKGFQIYNDEELTGLNYNPEKGIELYKRSAEYSFPLAQLMMGHLYSEGEGKYLKKDIKTALKWFEKAKENGDEEAIDILRKYKEEKPRGQITQVNSFKKAADVILQKG